MHIQQNQNPALPPHIRKVDATRQLIRAARGAIPAIEFAIERNLSGGHHVALRELVTAIKNAEAAL